MTVSDAPNCGITHWPFYCAPRVTNYAPK